MRISISNDPFSPLDDGKTWNRRGQWPAHWVSCADAAAPPFVTAYRCAFEAPHAQTVRVHVSADERYELWLDGQRIGRGPERGNLERWFFESYDLELSAGPHVLVARVWSLGDEAPYAQLTLRPGFLLASDDADWNEVLATGKANWQAKKLEGTSFIPALGGWLTGARFEVDGARFPWGFERGAGENWAPVVVGETGKSATYNDQIPSRMLFPAPLPPMMERAWQGAQVRLVSEIDAFSTSEVAIRAADNRADEQGNWQRVMDGGSLEVPAHTRRRVLVDLGDYVCAYPEILVSGGAGARVRVHWQEALYEDPQRGVKGDRAAIEGKFFTAVWHRKDGVGDLFRPDGGAHRRFEPLWWMCGRFVEIVVETGDEALQIESFTLHETRYPLEDESLFESDDARLGQIAPLMVRAMQECSHETYMDCPYFEQLMYVGDTRLECLTTYVMTRDDALPRKAIALFGDSILRSGLTQSRTPSRIRQVIPPFSLWWVTMIHDHILWRDASWARQFVPAMRGVLGAFEGYRNADGLVEAPNGWNYVDWVVGWRDGMSAGADRGVNASINWQFALALELAARVEEWAGETELAARNRRVAQEVARAAHDLFWDETRGAFAEDATRQSVSMHAQILAILSGQLAPSTLEAASRQVLEPGDDVARPTIMFRHYEFEALRAIGRGGEIVPRLDLWFGLLADNFKTTIEAPEPSRSDCHAWGAHPLYHYHASLAGVRPTAPGFERVEIAPQFGSLTHLRAQLPHPNGIIEAELRRENDALIAQVSLPAGASGELKWQGETRALQAGAQSLRVG